MKTKDLLNEEGFDYEGAEMDALAKQVAEMILSRAATFVKTNPDADVDPGDILMEQLEVFTDMVMQRIEKMS